ncbi:MAG: Sec23/Sec24 zinc finger-containing protein [Tenericutes bacterium HGW-Tenericutes-2]|nr:MAG: Sec23/Sec24 zinc finger-containing protein [Tenericutes bacterium HGW-Tenericutes-2]
MYSGDKFADVYWYCDKCNALLSKQKGFNDSCGFWHCSECGYKNEISEDHIDE